MKTDDLEQQLRRQPLRPPPTSWRAEIVAAAREAAAAERPAPGWAWPRWQAAWRHWLWPRPEAWAGLAAVWVAILVLRLYTPAMPAPRPGPRTWPRAEALQTYASQRQLLNQLLGSAAPVPPVAAGEPQKPLAPRPRTERRGATALA